MSRKGGSYVLNAEGEPELVERTGWKPPKPASKSPKKDSPKSTKRGAKK